MMIQWSKIIFRLTRPTSNSLVSLRHASCANTHLEPTLETEEIASDMVRSVCFLITKAFISTQYDSPHFSLEIENIDL